MIPTSCDTMVALPSATTTGSTVFAKNSDRPSDECQPLVQCDRSEHPARAEVPCQFVSIPQVPVTYRHVGSKPHWCWGYEHGFNEHQVVIGNEALHSKLEPAEEPRLIGMELIRLGLERARTAAEAVEVMTDLVSRVGQGEFVNDGDVRTYDNGYVVADPTEAYVIETCGRHWAVAQVQNWTAISNVYSLGTDWDRVSTGAEDFAEASGWRPAGSGRLDFGGAVNKNDTEDSSGWRRRRRARAVLSCEAGEIGPRTMIGLLSDHSDGQKPDEPFRTDVHGGTSICVHGKLDGSGGNTAASLVADLCSNGSRLPVYWCSLYSPCLSVFLPHFSEGEIPHVLSAGGPTPSDDSPWWLFHRLSYAARRTEQGVALVRERWAGFQDELFESAHELAGRTSDLIDQGCEKDAAAQLTHYMAENATRMLDTARELLATLKG